MADNTAAEQAAAAQAAASQAAAEQAAAAQAAASQAAAAQAAAAQAAAGPTASPPASPDLQPPAYRHSAIGLGQDRPANQLYAWHQPACRQHRALGHQPGLRIHYTIKPERPQLIDQTDHHSCLRIAEPKAIGTRSQRDADDRVEAVHHGQVRTTDQRTFQPAET